MSENNPSGPTRLSRVLTLEAARVTETAAIAAAHLVGRGDEQAADEAAVKAMRSELDTLEVDGKIVIGEGLPEAVSALFIGESVGTGDGQPVDIALDALEGTTLAAKSLPGALSVMAIAEAGSLLHAPNIYMDKIAVGSGYPEGVVDMDAEPGDNVRAIAKAKGVVVRDITVCVLDRPRNGTLIEAVREAGAAIQLIADGDIAGVIDTTDPETGIDMYMGSGGAPEGVLAAAALQCIGGQMQGRLVIRNDDDRAAVVAAGVEDPRKTYTIADMVSGDVLFAATGITDGSILDGIKISGGRVITHTLVMRSSSGTVRWIKASHSRTQLES